MGCKGEVKIAEWIRGSNISWTSAHNKQAFSYGNHCGKDITFWRTFTKQCHGASLIKFQLKSMIKSNGTYAVHGIYYPLPKGRELINSEDQLLLPLSVNTPATTSTVTGKSVTVTTDTDKRTREGKGSHTLCCTQMS